MFMPSNHFTKIFFLCWKSSVYDQLLYIKRMKFVNKEICNRVSLLLPKSIEKRNNIRSRLKSIPGINGNSHSW